MDAYGPVPPENRHNLVGISTRLAQNFLRSRKLSHQLHRPYVTGLLPCPGWKVHSKLPFERSTCVWGDLLQMSRVSMWGGVRLHWRHLSGQTASTCIWFLAWMLSIVQDILPILSLLKPSCSWYEFCWMLLLYATRHLGYIACSVAIVLITSWWKTVPVILFLRYLSSENDVLSMIVLK